MRRLSLSFVAVLMLAGCGSDSSSNPGTGGSTGSDPLSEVVKRKAPGGGCQIDCGPTTEEFFDNGKLASLKLTFDPADLKALGYDEDKWLDLLWDQWKVCNSNPVWLPAKLEYASPDGKGDVVMERVGVRLRGSKSRGKNRVQGMKIEFQKMVPSSADDAERRFADLKQINLLSVEADSSIMLQCMSYKLMRDLGVKAPRCNHLDVFINGEHYGLMQSVEKTNDTRFLKHQYGDKDGHLYGASTSCTLDAYKASLEYDGDTFTGSYQKAYEILRGDVGTAEKDLIPMFKCGDATTTPDDEEFKTCISDWIDVDEWLRVIAGESLISSLESLVGARRNAYLYFLPDAAAPHGGRMMIWGWDYDTGMQRTSCTNPYKAGGVGCDPFTSVAGWFDLPGLRPELVTRLTNVFKPEYCAIMQSFLSDQYKPVLVDEMAALIEPVMKDSVSPSYAEWQTEVARMRTYVENQLVAQQALIDTACK
ncbi:MAG TPA: CotH kinase family protein [Polyangiaceae bacterium]|nr:CotH kinase family protein [Polyangiaceae bacterium]